MINVTVSLQTKLEKSPFYFAVLHWIDPTTNKGKYKWKTTKVRYIDEKQKRLHKQGEKEANNKAEEIKREFENKLNAKIAEAGLHIANNRASQKFSDYMREWAKKQNGKKEETTSSAYGTIVTGIIAPYFDTLDVTIEELTPLHFRSLTLT